MVRAMAFVTPGSGLQMSPVEYFYRNKPPEYFTKILTERKGVMETLLKDDNGDPGCPINGQVQGLFFSTIVNPQTGKPIFYSPFGSRRLQVKATIMTKMFQNAYFSDFYCNRSRHYVTVVFTKQGSLTDAFCRDHLVRLDLQNNPFLLYDPDLDIILASQEVHVECFFTEGLRLFPLLRDEVAFFTDVPSSGTARFGGLPKREDCMVCNVYRKDLLGEVMGYAGNIFQGNQEEENEWLGDPSPRDLLW